MTCCKNPDVKNLDGWTGWLPGMGTRIVNRVCLKCKTHWHGYGDDVREYTRQEWDQLLEESCN